MAGTATALSQTGARIGTDRDAGYRRVDHAPEDWQQALYVRRQLAESGPGHERSVRLVDLIVAAVAERLAHPVAHFDHDSRHPHPAHVGPCSVSGCQSDIHVKVVSRAALIGYEVPPGGGPGRVSKTIRALRPTLRGGRRLTPRQQMTQAIIDTPLGNP